MIKDEFLKFLSLSDSVIKASDGWLTLTDGTRVMDFVSQYGASPFGGTDAQLAREIQGFFERRDPVLCQPLKTQNALALKRRLLQLAGFDGGEVFLCQSGAETVEVAIKLARSATGKRATIALSGGFHGKTTGAVQLTANSEYRDYFGVENQFVRHLEIGPICDLEADFAQLVGDGTVNALVLELVQGEGGMRALNVDWAQKLAKLCRENDVLLIVDEIQTGLGRLGASLAIDLYGIRPDMVLLSKALGGGIVPIGACIVAPRVTPTNFSIFHSSTFANNDFTCFVANAFLDRLNDLNRNAKDIGDYLEIQLNLLVEGFPDIFSRASGLGLMRGLHLKPLCDTQSYVSTFFWHSGLIAYAASAWLFRKRNLLALPCFSMTSCLRLQPPLTSDRAFVDSAISSLRALAQMLRSDTGYLSLIAPIEAKIDHQVPMRVAPTLAKPAVKKTAKLSRRLQFNMHPLHDRSYMNSLPRGVEHLNYGDSRLFDKRVTELSKIVSGFAAECYELPEMDFDGTNVGGRLFGINLTADQMLAQTPVERARTLGIIAKSATEYQADVVGLGAFTSIISRGGFLLRKLDAAVTAGSSLTAVSAVEAAMSKPALVTPAHFGVVGANGGVGMLCWQMLLLAATKTANISSIGLFYNPHNPLALAELAKSVKRCVSGWQHLPQCALGSVEINALCEVQTLAKPYFSMSDPRQALAGFAAAIAEVLGKDLIVISPSNDAAALRRVDRFLLATNSTQNLDSLYLHANNALLYDIGMPATVDPAMLKSSGSTSVTAGLVRASTPWEFGRGNIVDLPPGVMLGCFGETLTLAATDPGAAPAGALIRLDEAMRVGELARSIGFAPTVESLAPAAAGPHFEATEISIHTMAV